MKRAALMVVMCLFACGAAFASGETTLIDGSDLGYRIEEGGIISHCWQTTSSWWTPTGTTCTPTTVSSSCWTTGTTSYSTWMTCTTSITGYPGAAFDATYTHSVSASTVSGGFAPMALNDAFDAYNYISLRRSEVDIDYEASAYPILEDNGRQLSFSTQTLDNLQITRKVFVPENDEFCRWLNIVTNTGDAPEAVVMNIHGNLGSDSATVLIDSSNGDGVADASDQWIVSMQQFSGNTSSDPRLGHVLQGSAVPAPVSTIDFYNNNDITFWRYEFTLDPGETGIIMNFVSGQPTIAAARQKAIELSQPSGHALDYMTSEEKAAVLNFELTPYRTLTVNSLEDNETPGDGWVTLREAILAANSGRITDLGQLAGAYNLLDMTDLGGTLSLSGSLPTIASDMIIEGPSGAGKVTPVGVSIDGISMCRIMDVNNAHLTLKNLTLENGLAQGGHGADTNGGGGGGGALGAGGAVFVSGGSLRAVGVTFNHNGAVGGAGGDGDQLANPHTQGGGGGGMGGDGSGYTGGDGGVLGGTGGVSDGATAEGSGGGGAGNLAMGAGGGGGYGGGGGGGGSTDMSKIAVVGGGAGGAGGFAGGGGGAGGANGELPGLGGAGGTYGGAGGDSITGTASGGGGGGGAGFGGAIYAIGSSVSVESCAFNSNYAQHGLGGSGASPGGNGEGRGGAMFFDDGIRFWESANTFSGNDATTDEDDIHGAAEAAPAVLTISLLDGVVLTGNSARFLVIFSTNVTGVDASDFLIETTGNVTANVGSLEFMGDRCVVTLALGPSEGEVGIRVADDDTILDNSLVPLGGAGLANGEYSSDKYTVDIIPPSPPTVAVEELPGRFLTWTWAPGGGGNGTFRWRIDDDTWVETTDLSYITPDPADYGYHLFEVQERDDAGNWSDSGSVEAVVRQRLYVDAENGEVPSKSGDGSGSSWENAVGTIWYALMLAETDYVDIWVKSGLYVESNWLYGSERLYGGFAGIESTLEERDLSGRPSIITGDNDRAFTIVPGGYGKSKGQTLPGTIIDGFTLASNTTAYYAEKQIGGGQGAALYFTADWYDKALIEETSEPHRVANCVFNGNEAGYEGGAIYNDEANIEIENCIFSGNASLTGGAIYSNRGYLACANCTFSENQAVVKGSALYATGDYTLTNCIFERNRLQPAIYNALPDVPIKTPSYSEHIVRNCLFNNNCYADIYDGVVDDFFVGADEINSMPNASNNVDGDPLFATYGPEMLGGPVDFIDYDLPNRLVTITDLDASFYPGALIGRLVLIVGGGRPRVTVVEGEGEGEEGEGEGEDMCYFEEISCLVILDNTETTITALSILPSQPQYKEVITVDYLVLDYHLLPGSPAIDTGTDEDVPLTDIVGDPRPIDVWGTGADNTGSEWDIGAYEADFVHVVSITRADPSPTNAQYVVFDVLFSVPVWGFGPEDLDLTAAGTLADFEVDDSISTDDNTLYVVTVDTGTGDGTLRLDLIDDDSITDEDGDPLGGYWQGNGDFTTGEEYVIDKTPPELSNLLAVPRLAKLGTEVTITFNVSEPVEPPVVTVNGHAATPDSAKGVVPGYSYTYTIQETDPDGCATIAVSLEDTAGNNSSPEVCDVAILEVDKTPPEFTNIVANPPLANEGAVVGISFTASEPLDGVPVVTVNGHPATADKAAGSHWFIYTVQAGDPDGPAQIVITGQDPAGNPGQATNNTALTIDKTPPLFTNFMATPIIVKSGATVTITFGVTEPLVVAPTVSLLGTTATFVSFGAGYTYSFLVPPGAPEGPVDVVITGADLAGNPGLLSVDNAFTIDNTPPEFTNIVADPALAKEGTAVQITFAASEPLDGNPQVTVNGHAATMDKNGGYTFTYTVQAGDPDGPAAIVITGQDLAGNLGQTTNNDALTVDKTPPEFTNIVADPALAKEGAAVQITFAASEPLDGDPQVTVNGHAATPDKIAAGHLFVYTVQAGDPDGPATIVINGQDLAGNSGQTTNNDALTVDKTPPEFTNIVADPALAKEGVSVEITFTASEPLDSDPQVTVNGHPAAIDKADGDYWFVYTVQSTDPDGPATIVITGQDPAGNPGQASNTDALTIDKTPPEFTNIVAAPALAKEGTAVEITFTASEPLIGDPVVTVNGHPAAIDKADGNYWFVYTVQSTDPDGPATIVITGEDLAGNPGQATNTEALTVDKTPPDFIGILAQPPLAKQGVTVNIIFTATEPLTSDPVVTVNGHPASISSGKGVGYLFTYTVQAGDPDGPAQIVITGQDLAGNPGQATSNDALTIDKTPPLFTDIVADPALANGGRVVTITFSASETLDGEPDVTVNGHWTIQQFRKAEGYEFTYTVQASDPDGPATIVISGRDQAGNVGEATNTTALTIDQTPPGFTGIVANPAAAERSTGVAITFTASETLQSNPAVIVNGHAAAFVSASGLDYAYSYTLWASETFGAAEIRIVGQDLAGNLGTTVSMTALSIVDLVPPTMNIGAPSVGATRGGPVTFLVTYSVDTTMISLDGGDIALTGSGATGGVAVSDAGPFARLVTLSSITGNGTLGIGIVAGTGTDEFGNPTPAANSALFDVDNTGPVITVLGANPVTVMLNSTYTDDGATALDTRDGNLTASIQTVNNVDTSVEGDYTVTYDVADSLGNAAAQQVRTVHVVPLDECGAFAFPVDGSTITVAGGPDFWLVPILEADIEGAARLEFFLDGESIGEVAAPPYSISYAMTATETPVQYVLTVQAFDSENNVLCENTSTFDVVRAAQGEDGAGNGLPDNPFTSLPDLGNTWFSQNQSEDTGDVFVTAAANLHTCDTPEVPVVITLIDLEQRVTVTAPAGLFGECELAIVVFQMAPDLLTLLGAIESAVVLPEPDDVLLLGGMYYLCTVLVSTDQGATFDEIDPARLAANPVSLTVEGIAVPGDATFYTHDIFADSDPVSGVFIGGVAGIWDGSGLANIQLLADSVSVDVVKPTLFAPYAMKADKPVVWPWLAGLALMLGLAFGIGGDDDDDGGPCLIATAAYGTPMAAEIGTLRELRDEYLLSNPVGTLFVDAYYSVSPPIARIIASHPMLAAATRVALAPVVLLSRALLAAPLAMAIVLFAILIAAFLYRRARRARRAA